MGKEKDKMPYMIHLSLAENRRKWEQKKHRQRANRRSQSDVQISNLSVGVQRISGNASRKRRA